MGAPGPHLEERGEGQGREKEGEDGTSPSSLRQGGCACPLLARDDDLSPELCWGKTLARLWLPT